ncbi:MAG: hypothetical protein ACRC9R_07525, partial [Enterovibrio sp.]
RIGIRWDGSYTGVFINGEENKNTVGKGSISSSALSFSPDAINGLEPEITELLLRINEATDLSRRAFLLVKAMRAFSEKALLWQGELISFALLLGLNYHSVSSWTQTRPNKPTAANRAALKVHAATSTPAPLSLYLSIDILNWSELVRFFQENIYLQCRPSSQERIRNAAATPSAEGLFFDAGFIQQQEASLVELMLNFDRERACKTRNTLFAKIICVLKDVYYLPSGTFIHVCNLLKVPRSTVSGWYGKYMQTRSSANVAHFAPASRPQRADVVPNAPLHTTSSLFAATQTTQILQAPIATTSSMPAGVRFLSQLTATSTTPTVNATASATATTSSALMSALIAPQSAQATMRQAGVMMAPASSATPAVAAQQMSSNLPALAVSASSTTQQETQSNIAPPVFTAPIASSSVTAAQ